MVAEVEFRLIDEDDEYFYFEIFDIDNRYIRGVVYIGKVKSLRGNESLLKVKSK